MTTRRRKRWTPDRCEDCGVVVRWFARAEDVKKHRPYDPRPVTPLVRQLVIAHPVHGGQVWDPAELTEHFMRIRNCSRADAEAETAHVDWHRPHTCSPADTSAPTADEED